MNTFIRKFSEAALNRASKLKANELPIYLEKLVKQYINDNLYKHINENLYKHTNDINKIMIENERHILQSVDKKNKDEFWNIFKISLTGFGSVIFLSFQIKNEIDKKIEKIENKIEKLDEKINNKMDIIIESIRRTPPEFSYTRTINSIKKLN
jgi:preprotein translocase subunit Sss1